MYLGIHVHARTLTYMYLTTINEKETINLKENKEGYLGEFRGRKGRREMM